MSDDREIKALDLSIAELNGSVVTLTAYPKSHNKFTRTFDLRRLYPGAYEHARSWEDNPPEIDFDREHGMLAVGHEKNLDDRIHIELSEFLFID